MKKKLYKIFSELGSLDGFLYLLGDPFRRLKINSIGIIKYYVFIQPVQDSILSNKRGKNIEIKVIDKDSSLRCDFPRPSAVIDWRYESGSVCIAAYNKQKFAAYLWLSQNMYEEDEVRCDYFLYPKGKVYWDYDVYVEPKYRIGSTFPKLWDFANTYIKENGGVATMSRVSAFNSMSLRSHKRLGAQSLGSQTFFVFGSVQIMFSTFKPFIHLGVNEASRVKIRLDCPSEVLRK